MRETVRARTVIDELQEKPMAAECEGKFYLFHIKPVSSKLVVNTQLVFFLQIYRK